MIGIPVDPVRVNLASGVMDRRHEGVETGIRADICSNLFHRGINHSRIGGIGQIRPNVVGDGLERRKSDIRQLIGLFNCIQRPLICLFAEGRMPVLLLRTNPFLLQ